MTVHGSVALVTGGNRGLGDRFVRALLDAGASKVYAAARDRKQVTAEGAIPVALDLTDPASVRRVAELAQDVTLLINNAGTSLGADILTGDLADVRAEFETHVLGTLDVTRTFAPILARNGGGAVLNVLSVLSWFSMRGAAAYCAAKSAEWAVTNTLRAALKDQGTLVSALHVGYMDTDMTKGLDVPKADPTEVAKLALKALDAGQWEILADAPTEEAKAALSTPNLEARYMYGGLYSTPGAD